MSWLTEDYRGTQCVPDPDLATKSVLRAVYHVNLQLLRLLADIGEHPDTECPPLLTTLGAAVKRVGPSARDRLAQCPFLLVNAGFHDATRWRIAQRALNDAPVSDEEAEVGFRSKRIKLARLTLLTAWNVIRLNPQAADLILGASECTEVIAACSFTELEELAERHFDWITPRWEHRPENWYRLISLAQVPRCDSLTSVGLRGLFLFGGEFVCQWD